MSQHTTSLSDDWINKKICIISDLHSNLVAIEALYERLSIDGVERIICLGDLFTYGCEPNALLDALSALQRQWPLVMLKGNHDQFYFDREQGYDSLYQVPDFIKESVDWTQSQLKTPLSEAFDWHESLHIGPVYLAHANPYTYGDWSYLNTDDELLAASQALSEQNRRVGIFGHTHRPMLATIKNNRITHHQHSLDIHFDDISLQSAIINTGSLGQPRGKGSTYLSMRITQTRLECQHHQLRYDTDKHITSIQQSQLSDNGKEKLIHFFRKHL